MNPLHLPATPPPRASRQGSASWYLLIIVVVLAAALLASSTIAQRPAPSDAQQSQSSATTAPRPAPPAQAAVRGVPEVEQSRPLSCESAAVAAVTAYWGKPVTEAELVRSLPRNPNPHVGFRGDIDGQWGGTEDYGVYAEPFVPILQQRGFRAEVMYGSEERLKQEIAAGHPLVVWVTGKSGNFNTVTTTADGQTFTLTPYEHALVVTGYDQDSVTVMDVGPGKYETWGWQDFRRRWSYFDQMALVITPS